MTRPHEWAAEATRRPAAAHDVGTEARRAVIATALGVGLGALAALFAKRDAATATDVATATEVAPGAAGSRRRAWRGRSAT